MTKRNTNRGVAPRVFLIHGWDGRPDNHWFPYLALELKANGFEVNAPQMPNAINPRISEWLHFLKEYVGKPDKDTYFVGHSLGCLAVARYLEALPPKVRVGGCVFVAGFSTKLPLPEIVSYASFFHLPFSPDKARLHAYKFVAIFSDNDPDVPVETSLEFAKQLGAKTILERGKGHFTARDNVTALPSALTALLRMAKI